MLVNNISNLLLETEFFMDDKFLISYEEGLANKLKLGAAGAAVAGGLETARRHFNKNSIIKNKEDFIDKHNRSIKDNEFVINKTSSELKDKTFYASRFKDNLEKLRSQEDELIKKIKTLTSDKATYTNEESMKKLRSLKSEFDDVQSKITLAKRQTHDALYKVSKDSGEVLKANQNISNSKSEISKLSDGPKGTNLGDEHLNTQIGGGGLAIAGVAGAYLVYKFFKSLTYANWKIKNLEAKVKQKPELKNKLQLWYAKRDKIKQNLQVENKNFIEKTKLIKAKISELEKSKSNNLELQKLKVQLDKRMKFIQKIGAKV